MTPVDLLDILTLSFNVGVILSPLSAVATVAVIAGVGLVIVVSPVVTGVAAIDATLALTHWYFFS